MGEIVAPGTPPLGHPWGLTSGRAGPGWGLTVPGWGPHTSVGVPRVRPHMPRGGGVTRGNTKLEIARSPPSFNICILVTPSLPNRDAVPTYRYTPNRDAVGPTKSRCDGTCRIETVGPAESRRWDTYSLDPPLTPKPSRSPCGDKAFATRFARSLITSFGDRPVGRAKLDICRARRELSGAASTVSCGPRGRRWRVGLGGKTSPAPMVPTCILTSPC